MHRDSRAATRPDFAHERAAGGLVCGIDEVGRGPLAGPVLAAAVIFANPRRVPRGIDDSKRLTPEQRELLARKIRDCAEVAVAAASVAEIDAINILQASLLAMQRTVAALTSVPAHALIDGNRAPALCCPCTALVGGDGRSLSIAAASIVAKVARDQLMAELAAAHPGYGWERNAGYGTAEHLAALARLGPTAHHRQSFAPVRLAIEAGALTIAPAAVSVARHDDASSPLSRAST